MTDRIPYGREWDGLPPTCDDCGVPLGALHDPGCDVERCHHRTLDGQLQQKISCHECAILDCNEKGHDIRNGECYWCGFIPDE
ncbi:hypothetical protein RDE2_41330 [Rhodococcus sp. RDE2]|nr:hypothetical protein RDE2_41330 [Rhodococcus sp. RDE2]